MNYYLAKDLLSLPLSERLTEGPPILTQIGILTLRKMHTND